MKFLKEKSELDRTGWVLLPSLYPSSHVCSLCSEGLPTQMGPVTALHFVQTDELLVAGYGSGVLELWQHNTVVGQKQVRTRIKAEMCPEHRWDCVTMWCVCLFLCVRFQTVPSQQSAPCPITS